MMVRYSLKIRSNLKSIDKKMNVVIGVADDLPRNLFTGGYEDLDDDKWITISLKLQMPLIFKPLDMAKLSDCTVVVGR